MDWFSLWRPAPPPTGAPQRPVLLLKSVFGSSRPPVLFFGYPPKCGAGARDERRTLTEADYRAGKSGPPRMYFSHGGDVHAYNSVLNTLESAGMCETGHDDMRWSLHWGGCPKPALLREFHPLQKTNHFPASWQLGRKDLMWRNIRNMQRRWGKQFDITPASFVLPGGWASWEGAREQEPHAIWMWKPVNSSCGRGIQVLRSELSSEQERRFSSRTGVVQRYVERPLLLHGYKFDLRLYVVVTSFDPLKVYLNSEGLVRLATEKYVLSTKSLKHRTMHLTNYSVNKTAVAYRKNSDARAASGETSRRSSSALGPGTSGVAEEAEDDFDEDADGGSSSEQGGGSGSEAEPRAAAVGTGGGAGAGGGGGGVASKWSLEQLREHFRKEGLDWGLMMMRIKDLVIKALIAVEPPIVSAWHQGANFRGGGGARLLRGVGPNQTCFEIYGFDVIVDEALAPWLLEVNTCPSLSSSSPLDKRIKTKLIADALTLVGIFPFDHRLVDQAAKEESHSSGPSSQKSHNLRSLESSSLKDLGEAEWTTILDAHDELMRRGSLDRIFPTKDTADRYSEFFEAPRYSNAVLAKWLREGGERCFKRGFGALRPAWVPEQAIGDAC